MCGKKSILIILRFKENNNLIIVLWFFDWKIDIIMIKKVYWNKNIRLIRLKLNCESKLCGNF